MPKLNKQRSGVVAGTIDVSTTSGPDIATGTPAGAVLSRRRSAKARANKLEAKTRTAKATAKASARVKTVAVTAKPAKVTEVKTVGKTPRVTVVKIAAKPKATVRKSRS